MRYLLACTMAFLLSFLFAKAQEKDSVLTARRLGPTDVKAPEVQEGNTVISASRFAQSIDELPVTAYVITGEEIRENGYITLVDALKHVPGLRVSQPGTGFEGETFLMRGLLGNYYTKILINNIPIQPSVLGGLPIGEQLPIAQAERIEIIFGPASSLYGPDAMAGVINIILEESAQTVLARANLHMGRDGRRHVSLLAGGKLGSSKNVLNYNFFMNFGLRDDLNVKNNEDSVYAPINFLNLPENLERAIAQDPTLFNELVGELATGYQGTAYQPKMGAFPHQSYLFGFQANFRGLEFSFLEMYRRDFSALGRTPLLFDYSNPETFIGEKIQRFSLSLRSEKGRWSDQANVAYTRYRRDPLSSMGTNFDNGHNGRAYIYSASDDIFGEYFGSYSLSKRSEITVGASYTLSGNLPQVNDQGEPFNEAHYSPFTTEAPPAHPVMGDFGLHPIVYSNLGGFAQFYHNAPKFNATVGWRFDYHSLYGGNSYLRAAGLYRLGKRGALRGSVGFAVKAPSPNQIYASLAFLESPDTPMQSRIQYEQIPNLGLNPENLYALELGYRHKFGKKVRLDLQMFSNTITQQITGAFRPVDTLQYPRANNPFGGVPEARQYVNDANSSAVLIAFQAFVQARELLGRWRLKAVWGITLASGLEILPETGETIPAYRQQPERMTQWRISFWPLKNVFFHTELVSMSSWYRRYIPNEEAFNAPESKIPGYSTADFLLGYQLKKQLRFFVRLNNAFDIQHGGLDAEGLDIDLPYNPQRRRHVRIGITFEPTRRK